MKVKETVFELGRRHANLFLGFACFLQEQSSFSNVEALNFCTREGVFFKALFDSLFKGADDSIFNVETQLLEVSRLSTFAPSILQGQSLDFTRLFQLYKKQSAATLLTSLGLNPEDFGDLLDQYGIKADEKFDDPAKTPRLRHLLENEDFLARVKHALSAQRAQALGYLNQQFSNRNRLGFVDIGWQGTIQDSIAKLFPQKNFYGMYLGLALQRNEPQNNCQKVAYGPNRNLSTARRGLLDAVNVLEFVCLSNGGSAAGYKPGSNNSIVAVMRHDAEEDARVEEFSLPFQQGVLSVASETDPHSLLKEHLDGSLKARAMEDWRQLLRHPAPSLVNAYFSLKSNEEFGYGSVNDQSLVPSYSTVFFAPFSSSNRRNLIRYLTYSQWAEGMFARADLPLAKRSLLYGLMKMALIYKKISQDKKYIRAEQKIGQKTGTG